MKLYGLIGYPLGHSFSEKYFTEKFYREGIKDCVYKTFSLKTIDALPELLLQHPGLCGLNITIPYKQDIISFVTDTSHLPKGLNACNCVKIYDGKIIGYNTDVIGFEKSLLPLLQSHHTHALILGNGGAAEAVKYVLRKLKVNFKIAGRSLKNDTDYVYENIDETIITSHTLIINTTPLGTFPNADGCPALPYEFITPRHYLFDLVYNPSKTMFLQHGENKGAAIKNGYDMLEIQADESWAIWNNND
jgi:shikimate dehydrogenase